MSITKFAKCERNFVCLNFYLFPNDFLAFCYYTPAVALHTSNFLSHKKIPQPWDISKKLSFENTHNAGGICTIIYSIISERHPLCQPCKTARKEVLYFILLRWLRQPAVQNRNTRRSSLHPQESPYSLFLPEPSSYKQFPDTQR